MIFCYHHNEKETEENVVNPSLRWRILCMKFCGQSLINYVWLMTNGVYSITPRFLHNKEAMESGWGLISTVNLFLCIFVNCFGFRSSRPLDSIFLKKLLDYVSEHCLCIHILTLTYAGIWFSSCENTCWQEKQDPKALRCQVCRSVDS